MIQPYPVEATPAGLARHLPRDEGGHDQPARSPRRRRLRDPRGRPAGPPPRHRPAHPQGQRHLAGAPPRRHGTRGEPALRPLPASSTSSTGCSARCSCRSNRVDNRGRGSGRSTRARPADHRPQRRRRRVLRAVAARRRRGPARRRHVRQRGLWVPRRRPGHPVATCRAAARRGVAIGAQVGYRDLAGFCRRFVDVSADDLYADVLYQLAALDGIARTVGNAVTYVKPHGALYNAVVHHEVQADAVVRAVLRLLPLPVRGAVGSTLLAAAAAPGWHMRRGLRRPGSTAATLVPRSEPGALLDDPQESPPESFGSSGRAGCRRPTAPRSRSSRTRYASTGLPRGSRHGPCGPKRLVGPRSG